MNARILLALTAAMSMAGQALAFGPSSTELARALERHGLGKVSPASVRSIKCQGFDEEPTEFDCSWSQQSGKRWKRYSTYLAIDGGGWKLIDDVTSVDRNGGKH